MKSEWMFDPTVQALVATSVVDATLTVPRQTNQDTINNPNNTGSFFFMAVDGEAVAVNVGGPAIWGVHAIVEPGNFNGSNPVFLEPGLVLHFVSKTGAGFVSLIRARRAS